MSAGDPKRILVFGDSNSWGWIPRTDQQATARLGKNDRWPGVLAEKLGPGYEVVEEALSARTTNLDDPETDLPSEHLRGATLNGSKVLPALLASHLPLDLVVIMLGTNDLKARFKRTPGEIAQAAISLVQIIRECEGGVFTIYPSPKVLLLAPPPLGTAFHDPAVWIRGREKSLMLGAVFKSAATSANIPVFDTSEVIVTDGPDGVHLTAEAHQKLGRAVAEKVWQLLGE
jgi:lysophospholipase L1-like esterase